MMRSDRTTGAVTTGRPLDRNGNAMNGPALTLDPDGAAAAALTATDRPLAASPSTGVWATLLEPPDEGDTDRPVLLQWLAPDAATPPTHVHPATETFECVEGTFTVVVDGQPHRLAPGESLTVGPGREHTFRNDTEDVVAVRAELPSMQTLRGLYTAWGLDVDSGFDDGDFGDPGPLQGLVLAADLHPETRMTMAPLSVQRALWATVGRAARTVGIDGVDERYVTDAFWERRVEQPAL